MNKLKTETGRTEHSPVMNTNGLRRTKKCSRFRSALAGRLIGMIMLFPFLGTAQGLTSLFCDFSGAQPTLVDTTSANGRGLKSSMQAKSQIAIGVKFMEMNVNRDLHLGIILCYRQINMSNFGLIDQSHQPIYEKVSLVECLLGGTYLPRKPLHQTSKMAIHLTLSGYAGFQGFSFGSNISGGLVVLSKEGVAGVTLELVYRPLEYSYPNSGNDPFYIKLEPSWSIRAAITFGKNLKYNSN
jgi:hypothetical protein